MKGFSIRNKNENSEDSGVNNVNMDVDVDNSSAVNRVNTTTESNDVSSVSATNVHGIPLMTSENISGCRLIDIEILFIVFKELVCPSCYIF